MCFLIAFVSKQMVSDSSWDSYKQTLHLIIGNRKGRSSEFPFFSLHSHTQIL